MTNTRFSTLLFVVIAVAACSKTTTSIPQSYRNPGYEQTVFSNLLVIGVAQNQENRQAFEDAFASAIATQGGRAEASWSLLPDSTQLSKEQIVGVIEGGGFDGVLITRLLAVEKDQEYKEGSTYGKPQTRYYGASYGNVYGGYGGYYGFYGTTYTQVHESGYFETSTTVRVETNLYSAATEELVWTGQSETVDPKSIPEARASMTEAVAKTLKSEHLIP